MITLRRTKAVLALLAWFTFPYIAKAEQIETSELIQGNHLISQKLQFKVTKPAGWKFAEASSVHCVLVPDTVSEDAYPRPTIILRTATLSGRPNDQEVEEMVRRDFEREMRKRLVEIKDMVRHTTELGGKPAVDLHYQAHAVKDVQTKTTETKSAVVFEVGVEPAEMRQRVVYQVRGNQLFQILYGGEQNLYEQHLEDFEAFLRSLSPLQKEP